MEIQQIVDLPEARFEITVQDSALTKHIVTLTQEYFQALTAGAATPLELIRASFEFLLAREPNTSILSAFDLKVISTYFPEYEREMKDKFR